jgi:RNA recognition motif-containing protein
MQGMQFSSACEELNSSPLEHVEENDDRTTIMVRNLSNDLSQTDFVKDLLARGYRGLFDFVYMPMNFRSDGNFGYAFVNFASAEVALQFMKKLQLLEHDEKEWRSVWSTCQGVDTKPGIGAPMISSSSMEAANDTNDTRDNFLVIELGPSFSSSSSIVAANDTRDTCLATEEVDAFRGLKLLFAFNSREDSPISSSESVESANDTRLSLVYVLSSSRT